MRIRLELVTKRKLHLARPLAASGRECAKRTAIDVGIGIDEVLVVKGVERFGIELQLLAFRHPNLLFEPEIHCPVSRSTQIVPISDLPAERIRESGKRVCRAGKILQVSSFIVNLASKGRHVSVEDSRHPIHVPEKVTNGIRT